MNYRENERIYASEGPTVEFDQGLRQLMLSMYNHTASGLAVSGAVAWLTYSSGLLYSMGGLIWIAMFAPLGMIFWYSFAGQNWDLKKLTLFFDLNLGLLRSTGAFEKTRTLTCKIL